MSKDHARDHGVPHGADRVVVSPAAPPGFEELHELIVWQPLEDGLESREVAFSLDDLPVQEVWL